MAADAEAREGEEAKAAAQLTDPDAYTSEDEAGDNKSVATDEEEEAGGKVVMSDKEAADITIARHLGKDFLVLVGCLVASISRATG